MTTPNVLLLVVDCLRADRAAGAGGARTPTLDRLARSGTRFAEMVSSAVYTTPSFSTILTGLFPFQHGVRDQRSRLGEGVGTLPERLRGAGYRTAALVTGPLARETGIARGFDRWEQRATSEYLDAGLGGRLRETLRALERPSFVLVHLWELHWPRHVPGAFDRAASGATRYDRALSALDAGLGAVLDAAGADTIVAITGDHGERLDTPHDDVRARGRIVDRALRPAWNAYRALLQGRVPAAARRRLDFRARVGFGARLHGFEVTEQLIRVPFLLAGPGIPAGRTVAAQVRHVDIAPTILDLAGVAARADLEPSLRPLLEGEGADRPAYAEATGRLGSGRETWLACLREREYKYVMRPYAPGRPGMLIDPAVDPLERTDVSASLPERSREMRERLIAMIDGGGPHDAAGLSAEEEAAINKRLADLGYLEA